jgi:hypothetical protein
MVEDLLLQAMEIRQLFEKLEDEYTDHDPDWLIEQLTKIRKLIATLDNDTDIRIEYIRDEVKPDWVGDYE